MPALITNQVGTVVELESLGGNSNQIAQYPELILDIAVTPDGSVYATTHNALYQLDLATASSTIVAELGGALDYFPNALTSDDDGNLYFGYSNRSDIHVFDPVAGIVVRAFDLDEILPENVFGRQLEDMLILNGRLYGINGSRDLLEFEISSTGSLIFLNDTESQPFVGLFSENGNIYGVNNDGSVFIFDPASGAQEFEERIHTGAIVTGAASLSSDTITIPTPDPDSGFEIYRFLNTVSGAHFFTASIEERDHILQTIPAFTFEGNVFDSNATEANGGVPVYRFYNTQTGTHLYTASEEERQNITANLPHIIFEEISYYAYSEASDSNEALYRFFNTQNGTHFFTASEAERDNIIGTLSHYNYEGVAYYVDMA